MPGEKNSNTIAPNARPPVRSVCLTGFARIVLAFRSDAVGASEACALADGGVRSRSEECGRLLAVGELVHHLGEARPVDTFAALAVASVPVQRPAAHLQAADLLLVGEE